MQQQLFDDDWEMYDTTEQIVLHTRSSITDQLFNNKDLEIKSVSMTRVIVAPVVKRVEPVGHKNTDLENLATRSIPIFKNSRINANLQVRPVGEFFKMRIFGQLNKLWDVPNLERYLKSAIDFYDKSCKATTTKTNQKQVDILVKSIDRLNGIISAINQQLRINYNDDVAQVRLRETILTKENLEREQSSLLAVSVNDKKMTQLN
jgi:hypothetical protein